MQKFKTFIQSFQRSVTDFSYYRELLKYDFWFSIKYIFLLTFLSIFLQTVIFAVQTAFLLPRLPSGMDYLEKRLIEMYPQELVVKIEDGRLSTNQSNPYHIDVPEMKELGNFRHFITINTEASISDFEKAGSFMLVTDRAIVLPDDPTGQQLSSYQVMSLNDIPDDVVIDQKTYRSWIGRLDPVFAMIPKIAPFVLLAGVLIIPIFGMLYSAGSNLLILLLLNVVVWMVSMAFGLKLGYWKLYQLGIHGLTIPMLLTMILTGMNVYMPLVFTSAFLLWMVLVLSHLSKTK
ncbi:DUF1189 family protein [Candidatus Roizmanbacteria bacterium]|nr:MAG: DUF1189 family protein [Candidatus Roizmanbacteria bacterium]